jgi:hypothetical protein
MARPGLRSESATRPALKRAGRHLLVVATGTVLALMTACGGDGFTDPSDLSTFHGDYTLTLGTHTWPASVGDAAYTGHREVIVHGGGSALECSVRLDFTYAKKGQSADEVSGVQIIGFGDPSCPLVMADLSTTAGAPAPKVVVRNSRNEIDDGVVSGTAGWPTVVQMTGVHWSLRAR